MEQEQSSSSLVRIFVGGLGQSVTAGDLKQTFSSLGTLTGVEIIRTNDRSFAYMDFLPDSERSLAKLFSSYNGCIWKGGRLRLEKAKEHYLARLRREWADDSKQATGPEDHLDLDKCLDSSGKSKHLTQEKMQLRIFFPRLKKVKLLPYSGCGKHKYSFQRVEVPSLPVNFCDCEEHCRASETVNHKHFSTLDTHMGGVNKEELETMNSVMEKLFERDVNLKTGDGEKALIMEGRDPKSSVDDVELDEKEGDAEEEDADDLVTNIATRRDSISDSMQFQGWDTFLVNQKLQESKSSKFVKPTKGDPGQTKPKSQKMLNLRPTNVTDADHNSIKEAGVHPADGEEENETRSVIPKKRKISKIHFGEPFAAEPRPTETQTESNIGREENEELRSEKPKMRKISDTRSEEPKSVTDSCHAGIQTELKMPTEQSSRSWLQKSSWKELVGEACDGSFRISHIVSGLPSVKQKPSKPKSQKKLNLRPTNVTDANHNSIKESHVPPADGEEENEGGSVIPRGKISKTHLGEPFVAEPLATGTQTESNMGREESEESRSEKPKMRKITDAHSEEPKQVTEVCPAGIQIELKMTTGQSSRGSSWLQKSSWKELVGEAGDGSFRISHIVSGLPSVKQKPSKVSDSKILGSGYFKSQKTETQAGEGISKTAGVGKGRILMKEKVMKVGNCNFEKSGKKEMVETGEGNSNAAEVGEQMVLKENLRDEEENNSGCSKVPEKSTDPKPKTAMEVVNCGEVCTFMRSAQSEREWAKVRASVSGFLRKRSTVNTSSSRGFKGMSNRKL